MNREELFELSEKRRAEALKIVRDSGIVEAWESVGAEVNMVGSVRSGLIMKNFDIDFHIYSDNPMSERSCTAIAKLKKNPSISNITFTDLLATEEECLEWHAQYEDDNKNLWQLDMIHIRRGSRYDGIIEQTTDAIRSKLTPQTREAILRIKYDAPENVKVYGIEVYYAVLELGVRTYEEFAAWKQTTPNINLLGWIPA